MARNRKSLWSTIAEEARPRFIAGLALAIIAGLARLVFDTGSEFAEHGRRLDRAEHAITELQSNRRSAQ